MVYAKNVIMKKTEFKNGVLTPALQKMALDTLEKINDRIDSYILKKVEGNISFISIIENLKSGKYIQFDELNNSINKFISNGMESESECVRIIILDIKPKIQKKLSLIQKLSECKFKDVSNECYENLVLAFDIKQEEIEEEKKRQEGERERVIKTRKELIQKAMEDISPTKDIPICIK